METTGKRVLVIGLDGATFDLIEPWAAQGYLPNLAWLMSEGCRGHLASTIQPTTAPAWVTFMTGVNQGKHGLYDFVRRRPDGYSLQVTNASHIAAPTIFDIASKLKRRVIAINVPYTSPPHPVNGFVIGGPFTPTVTRSLVFPATFFETLQEIVPDYFILPDYNPRAADPLSDYASNLQRGIALRERLSLHFLCNEPWDLFTVVFMATDEAQHSYWHCMDAPAGSPEARYRHVIRKIYQRIDQAVGALLAQVEADGTGRETVVIILSDHGFGPFRWMINLNRWLAEAGHIRFRTDGVTPLRRLWAGCMRRMAHTYQHYIPAQTRAAIRARVGARRFGRFKEDFESALFTSAIAWDQTRAYTVGAGGNVFINLKGREPAGIVHPGTEYEQLCQELSDAFMTLCEPDTGRPVVRRVYRREELYHGPFLAQAPDLIIQWEDYANWGRGQYDSHTPLFEAQRKLDFSARPLTGSHRPEGVLILNGPGVRSAGHIKDARILDLAPTILSILGLSIPRHIDGRVLHSAFIEGAIKSISSPAAEPTTLSAEDKFTYTPEDAAKISQHLKDLGYL